MRNAGLVFGMVGGVVGGVGTALIFGLAGGPLLTVLLTLTGFSRVSWELIALVLAFTMAGLVGVALGLVFGLPPRLALALALGPVLGLVSGIVLGNVPRPSFVLLGNGATDFVFSGRPGTLGFLGLPVGPAFGLAFLLIVGLAGGMDAWLYYHWACHRLARKGSLPRRLLAFLEWCALPERGWLRLSDACEFRHRELLDHLASDTDTEGRG
jgi:hypothetical protein